MLCWVQEIRWKGASARLITRKNSEYKMYWVGNNLGLSGVGILVAGKWIDKIFHVKCINDRLMMIKLLVGKGTITIVSTNALQQELAEDAKDKFYKDLISLSSKVGENEPVIHGGDLIRYVGKDVNGYDGEFMEVLGMVSEIYREREYLIWNQH